MEKKILEATEKAFDKAIKDPTKNAYENVKIGNGMIKVSVNAVNSKIIWIGIKNKGVTKWP